MSNMRRLGAAAVFAAVLAAGLTAMPQEANAWWRGAVGYGVVVPPVVAGPPVYAVPPRVYAVPPPVYVAPPPVYVGPPVVYARPPVTYYPGPRVWIPAHWRGGYWVPGHWR